MQMSRFTKAALLKEYPWLAEIKRTYDDSLWLDRADEVKFARIDEELLGRVPQDQSHVGSMGQSHNCDIYWVVVNGVPERLAITPEQYHQSNYAHEGTTSSAGLPLADSFAGLPEETIKGFQYLVRVDDDLNDWSGSDSYANIKITIYKPAKEDGFISKVLEIYYAEAARQVVAESSF